MKALRRIVLSVILILFYTYLNIEGKQTSTAKKLYAKGKETIGIYYPELIPVVPLKNFTLTIPKECERIGICEKIPNYPQKYIWDIIKMISMKNVQYHKDVNPLREGQYETFSESEDLCSSKKKEWCPQAVRDIYNNWHLALNTEFCLQSFYGEECRKSDASQLMCSSVAVFSNNFKGVCEQKVMIKKIIILDINMHYVRKIKTKVPSCCACVAKREEGLFEDNN